MHRGPEDYFAAVAFLQSGVEEAFNNLTAPTGTQLVDDVLCQV
jgi:hypothetical protein